MFWPRAGSFVNRVFRNVQSRCLGRGWNVFSFFGFI